MINLDQTKKCGYSGCPNVPLSVIDSLNFCAEHYSDETLISLAKKECSICDLAPNSYVCKTCESQKKRKEWQTICMLKKRIRQQPICDKIPVPDCTRKRPDVLYQSLKHVVIVEVDEDQHLRYDPVCECARISEFVGSFGGLSITIIRYKSR